MANLPAVTQIKGLLSNINVKQRFNEILGENASAFMASIVNTVSGSTQLQKCDPNSVMSASFIAASLDLPIDQNLGFAAIVPYKEKAQFQIMWKGLVQLAIRSGQYKGMNVAEVYEDELISYNPITGEAEFIANFKKDSMRTRGLEENVCGFYAWFSLINGFKKSLYMSFEEVDHHAKTYSKSYQYDIRGNKKTSRWSIDFCAMGRKTVVKMLLSKWGIMSTKMQKAVVEDQKVFYSENGEYIDNPTNKITSEKPFDALSTPKIEAPKTDEFTVFSDDIKSCKQIIDLDGVLFDLENSKLTDIEKSKILSKIEMRKVELKGSNNG